MARGLERSLRPRSARPPTRVRIRAPGTRRVRPQHAGPGPQRRRRLWAYATGEWLTYRSPTSDQTRSRWPLAPEWLQVQAATLGHQAVGLERLRLARRATSIEKLFPGLTGYLASLGALIGTEGIDDPWEPSGIICTPTRSSVTRSLPTGWPAAAAEPRNSGSAHQGLDGARDRAVCSPNFRLVQKGRRAGRGQIRV